MTISHQPEQGAFYYITDQQKQAGKLLYRVIGENRIEAFSTKVEADFQGKGIAGELYQALIAFAKANQLKIKPSCSYIEVKMQRSHPDLIG